MKGANTQFGHDNTITDIFLVRIFPFKKRKEKIKKDIIPIILKEKRKDREEYNSHYFKFCSTTLVLLLKHNLSTKKSRVTKF